MRILPRLRRVLEHEGPKAPSAPTGNAKSAKKRDPVPVLLILPAPATYCLAAGGRAACERQL
ncbi:hypothetical protein C0Z19_20490 [Trinickia soli]|uniref:Uncharacterized protein n=1 Tax=Trinickia soli TaxID=380675 RepID=A0A2N7VT33_9BURK|nr:hypothetical protein CIW54_10230 [Paraburkholderia sp. T12-10]PMS20289.1 hypothetical protein C0Z19_20490 [Trinickia soli]